MPGRSSVLAEPLLEDRTGYHDSISCGVKLLRALSVLLCLVLLTFCSSCFSTRHWGPYAEHAVIRDSTITMIAQHMFGKTIHPIIHASRAALRIPFAGAHVPSVPIVKAHGIVGDKELPQADSKVKVAADTGRPHSGFSSIFNFDEMGRLWGGKSEIPVADLPLAEWGELLKEANGVLFIIVKALQERFGDAFLLPTGVSSSFLVLSDPQSAGHVLEGSYETYDKGMARELTVDLFGDGLLVANPGKPWLIRKRQMTPALHKKFLDAMVQKVFANCTFETIRVMSTNPPGQAVDMENIMRELTLDIIGKAVFNYDFKFGGQKKENPIADAIYTALNEADLRIRDVVPLWKLPKELAALISPRQRRVADATALVRKATEDLIENCRKQLEAEEAAGTAAAFNGEDYVSETDPSVLRFLIASKEEIRSSDLRDDMLNMLVAGHETTASTLAWTLLLLVQNPDKMANVQKEIDTVLGAKIKSGNLTIADLRSVNYLRWCVAESMRLYPHPPTLIRRAMQDDVLPSGLKVAQGQDVMIPVYNVHRSMSVWGPDADTFLPERWSKYARPNDNPNEKNTNYSYIPFGGGPRKCIGDQFALIEAYAIFAVLLYKFDFQLLEGHKITMKMAGTIHTADGMLMTYSPRPR